MQKTFRLGSLPLAVLVAACSSADAPNAEPAEEGDEATAVSVEAIIGGTPASAYPEAAVLDIDRSATGSYYACSATLIAPRAVLTAGHCVDGHAKWDVYVHNEYRLSTTGITYDWAENGAKVVNPKHHDIGLVFFDQPIAMPAYPTLATSPLPDKSKVLNIGRILDGTFTSSSYQAPAVVSSAAVIGYPFDYMSADVIQPGDSGGAVMADGTHEIVAVNSGAGGGVQVLARVDLLATWIKTQVAAHSPSAPPPPPPAPKADAGAGAPSPDGGVPACAAEREPNNGPGAANPMPGKSFCGRLASASDVDWVRVTVPRGTTTLQLTSSGDALFSIGRPTNGTCLVLLAGQKVARVTSMGGATPLCAVIASPGHKTQTYALTAKN